MSVQDEEEPLDPTLERVRRKMIRLMVISIGIMMVGLMAVLFAIVYKISSPATESAGEEPAIVGVPAGADVLSTSLDGERILVEIDPGDGSRQLVVIAADSGKVVSRIVLQPE